jgi:type II secretory pathway component GspD/PulD (secretin)
VELGEVESLLRKLGEIPADNSIDRTIRVIDASGEKDARELLRQIQQAWPSISPNPLQDNSASTKENSGKDDEPSAESSTTQYEEIVPDLKPATPIKLAQIVGEAVEIRPAEAKSAEAMPAKPGNPPAKKTPPIKIDLTPDGRIVATSDDPKALDLFEDLAGQLIEDRKEYKVFRLKYCVASDIKDILDDFFKTEPKKEQRRYPPWWYDDDGSQNKEDPARLSKKRPIKFIADSTTNSILVQGADAKQLRTIQELIAVYNQPTPSDSQSNRVTESVHLEYSKADVVADTVKEVYRDLLSTNDKAFGKKDDRDSNRGYFWGYDSEDSSKKEQKTPKFKGLLSIGVDEVSNTVVVSAPAYLFEQVKGMILELDKAAAPASTTRVIKLGPGMRGPDVQKRLLEALGQDTTKEEPDDKKTPPEGNGEPKKEKKNGKKKS